MQRVARVARENVIFWDEVFLQGDFHESYSVVSNGGLQRSEFSQIPHTLGDLKLMEGCDNICKAKGTTGLNLKLYRSLIKALSLPNDGF